LTGLQQVLHFFWFLSTKLPDNDNHWSIQGAVSILAANGNKQQITMSFMGLPAIFFGKQMG
jgi:hypothetical protein